MHTYVCFHTCTYMQTYIYACKDYIRKDAHVLSCNIYIYVYVHVYTYECICMSACLHVHVLTHVHIHKDLGPSLKVAINDLPAKSSTCMCTLFIII